MDYELVLRELFPQIDVRLIKATVLDGDDIESAVDFLVKEGLRSDALTSEQVLGVAGDSSTNSRNEKTDALMEFCVESSDESTHIPVGKESNFVDDGQVEELSEVSSEKHEESIVWLGGLRTHPPLSSADDHSTNKSPSCGELEDAGELYMDHLCHNSDESNGFESQRGTALVEDARFADTSASLQPHNLFNSSLNFDIFVSNQHQSRSQPLDTTNILTSGSLPDLKHEPVLLEKLEVKFAVPETMNISNPSPVLLDNQQIRTEFRAPKSLDMILCEGSSDNIKFSEGYLEASPFTGSSAEHFEPVSYLEPQPSYDQSVNVDLAHGYCVQESMSGSVRHSLHIEDMEKLVQEAKCHKEKLLSAIEDIHSLRLKTEKEEVAAQRAKAEALNGGLDILEKVEEMRQAVAEARVKNEERAAEIYGEKAVLSTEARELNSRLAQAKAEQTSALTIINDIQSILLARLEKATQESQAANEERKRKERHAQELLAIEQSSLEKVIHISSELDAEEEACTKLRDFLIDGGKIVDSLQGETAVLCEDVETFKKQVEEGILLSSCHSLSTSHVSHLTDENLRQRSVTSSQDLQRMIFSQAGTNTEGSAMALAGSVADTEGSGMALAGSVSSSCRSLKCFVSRTSSYNSYGSPSAHSALGLENSIDGMIEPFMEESNPQPVDSTLCTDYFSPSNSVLKMTSERAFTCGFDTYIMNSQLTSINGENGFDQFCVQSDEGRSQKSITAASSSADDDLHGWHIHSEDEDWHMLRAQKANKGSFSSTSSSMDAQLLEKVG